MLPLCTARYLHTLCVSIKVESHYTTSALPTLYSYTWSFLQKNMTGNGSATGKAALNGHNFSNNIEQPRPRRFLDSRLARSLHGELSTHNAAPSGLASERGTPAPPEDAAPSVKATSSARKQNRKKTRQQRIFPSVEFEHRLSYFDPNSSYNNFRGFYVLFWIGLAIMVITTMLRNLKETGTILNFRQWPLFVQNIEELGISDGLMCASTMLSMPLNRLFLRSRGILRWDCGGLIIQSIFQGMWLWFWIATPFVRDWTWTAQVFFTLHTLTLFMKMHSYAFYNGHLSATFQRLKELDLPLPPTLTTAAVRYPSAHDSIADPNADGEDEKASEHISPIMQLRDDLATELTSPLGNVSYPQNLTVANFVDYIFCPTLCYELEYPRMPKRSYLELFYKTLAVAGCIFLMTITSEEFIIPVLNECAVRLRLSRSWIDSSLIFAECVSSLLFPFMITFLLGELRNARRCHVFC